MTRANTRLAALTLMCVSFSVAWLMEYRLFETGALLQPDVWFQADPDIFMSTLVDPGAFAIRHPNVGLFIGLPIAAIERLLSTVGASSPGLHDWLVLMIAPLAAAVRSLAAYHALLALTRREGVAVLLTLLDIVAFQTVALASIPEHYPLSAACIAGMYWLMMDDMRTDRPLRLWRWLALGTLAVGITVSNLLPFGILLLATLLRRETARRRMLRIGALLTFGILALNAALAWGRSALAGRALLAQVDTSNSDVSLRWPALANAPEIGWAIAHTFVAPAPEFVLGRENESTNPDYGFQILYPSEPSRDLASWWRALLTAGMVAMGIVGYGRGKQHVMMAVPAAAIIVAHGLLFLVYGHHFFVYGLHWSFSMMWLIAGVAFLPPGFRSYSVGMLSHFVLLTACDSFQLASRLLERLWIA